MANEGEASVKIVGDVRDFARQVEADLNRELKKIRPDPVRLTVDSDHLRDSGAAAGKAFGADIADGAADELRDSKEKVARAASDASDHAATSGGKRFRDRFGRESLAGFTSAASEGVKAFSSRIKDGFDKSNGFIKSVRDSFSRVGDVIGGALSGVTSVIAPIAGAIGTAIGVPILVALGAVLLPGIASTVAAAVTSLAGVGIGLGLIGLGAFALKEVKPLQNAFKDLGKSIQDVGQRAAKPLLKPLIAEIGNIKQLFRQLEPEFKSIFESLAPALKPLNESLGKFVGSLVRGIKDSMPGIVAALEGFGKGLEYAGDVLGDFFRTIFSNEDLIDNTTEGLMKFIFGPLKLLGPLISGLNVIFGAFNNALVLLSESNIFGQIGDQILAFVDGGSGAIGRITEAWGPLGEAIQNVWDKIKEFAAEDDPKKLEEKFVAVVDAIKEAWGPLQEFIGVVWEEALAFVQRVWEEQFLPWWEDTAKPWLEQAIKAAFQMAWDAAVEIVRNRVNMVISTVQNGISRVLAIMRGSLAAVPGIAANAFQQANARIAGVFQSIIATAGNGARIAMDRIRTGFAVARGIVTNAFAGAAGWLLSAGRSIIDGLVNGIRGAYGRVQSAVAGLGSLIPGWARGALGINSPAKVMIPIGASTMEGVEVGINKRLGNLRSLIQNVGGDMSGWMGSAVPSARTSAAATSTFTILPGAIQINGMGGDAGNRAAEAVLQRLAQAGMVR